MDQHAAPCIRFTWNGKGDLLCGRVAVGWVALRPPYEGGDGPWFGMVGTGYPAPFEAYFDSEADARATVEAAARRLMFEEAR